MKFVNARFEDAQLPHNHFRAVFSASAFQWIDPEVSWQKAARLLVPGGTLALIQYCGLNEERSIDDQEALLSALARIAPEIAATWPSYRDLAATVAGAEQRRANVSEVWAWVGSHDVARSYASRLFCDVQVAAVPMLLEQTADELNAFFARRRSTSGSHRSSVKPLRANTSRSTSDSGGRSARVPSLSLSQHDAVPRSEPSREWTIARIESPQAGTGLS